MNNNTHSDLRKKRDIYEFGLGSRGTLAYGHGDDFDSIICEFWGKKWAETTKKN